MFSRHRKGIIWTLYILSVLLLATGVSLMGISRNGQFYPSETTAVYGTLDPHNTSVPATEATMVPTTSLYYSTFSSAGQIEAPEPSRNLDILLYGGMASILLSTVLGLIFIFIKQDKPIVGPELEIPGLVLIYAFLRAIIGAPFGLTYFLALLACFAGLLAFIRGCLWWIIHKLHYTWSIFHRIAMRISTKKRVYLLVEVLCCAAGILCFFWAFVPIRNMEPINDLLWAARVVLAAVSIALSLCGIIHVGADADHLVQQIASLHQSERISVKDGLFSEQERQLQTLGIQRDEAVKKAVTGERFKVELISNVSHDLRTPLTAILGYGELLEQEHLSPEGQERLSRLNQKAGYMRELVDSLFELTKVSSGAVEPKWERIDLIRLLEQTIGIFDDQLTAQNLTVRRHYEMETLSLVTDGSRLHQVFANLLGNAIKYALSGTRIHLEVKANQDACTVRMTNISSYEMDFTPEQIVQRFTRGDKARTTKGSGIGLAIAQTYTQSVGGEFRVHIDGDQFSATVTLPAIDSYSSV